MNAKIIIAIGLIGLVTNPLNVQAGNDKQPLRDMTIVDADGLEDEEYEESEAIIEEAYETLPEYAKEMLDDVEVILSDDEKFIENFIYETYGVELEESASVCYDTSNQIIRLETFPYNNGDNSKNDILSRFYFEVGAAIYGDYTENLDFKSEIDVDYLYEKESGNFVKTDFYSKSNIFYEGITLNNLSYMSGVLSCYLIAPKELKESCPETYGFVDTMVREYCELKGYTFVEPVLEEGEEPKVPDTSEVIEEEVLVEVEEPEVIEETTAVELEPVEEIETEENIVEEPKKDSNMFPIVGGIAGVVVLGGAIGLGMKKKK